MGALGIDLETLQKEIESRFGKKGDEILEKNLYAAEKGYEMVDEGRIKKTKRRCCRRKKFRWMKPIRFWWGGVLPERPCWKRMIC